MDAPTYQELSCKACYYSTSQLLDFLNHVRKVHYERHASKTDLPRKDEPRLVSGTSSSTTEPNVISSETEIATAEQDTIAGTGNTESVSAHKPASHSNYPGDHLVSPFHVDQVSVKHEAIECEELGEIRKGIDTDENLQDFAQSRSESATIKMESIDSQVCDEVSLKDTSTRLTASGLESPTPFRGNKINNIADTLKVGYTSGTKPFIDPSTGTGDAFCGDPKSFPVQFSTSKEVLISNTCQTSLGFCMPSDRDRSPTYFLSRRNSVPVSMHHTADRSRSASTCTENGIFQPFPNAMNKQGFPNYLPRYASHNVNIHPQHQLTFHTVDGNFSQGLSLFDSTGEFLPGFHALMCAGFVTMPQTQVLQSIKCDEKKWEYIQQTLHNAFRKFPYLTAPEVQILANLTELTCQQVKTLFAVARLQHSISWDQEEIQNARNYLRIPGNRFCGEG